jgi:hypothetical protein
MKVVRENNQYKITIPDDIVDIVEIQNFLDYLKAKSITSKSKASESEIEYIAREIKKNWWEKRYKKDED